MAQIEKSELGNVIETDIVVAGAGPTAYASALAASRAGFEVVLVAPQGTFVDSDARTTALMQPAIELLEDLGVWEQASTHGAPMRVLRIVDATGRLFRAPTVDFKSIDAGEPQFGFNITNKHLNAAFNARVLQDSKITTIDAMVSGVANDDELVRVALSDGRSLAAKLIIAADGVNSVVRRSAEIDTRQWSYPQTALVTTFDHTRPHHDESTEFHTPSGPFTQVPLEGDRSSLVWVVKPEDAEILSNLSLEEMAQRIERRMDSMLGKVSNVAKVQAWPLSSLIAHQFSAHRVLLAGQSGHAFPPIGAQGLNLGFRDVADIAHCLGKADRRDPGAKVVTRSYNRRRLADVYTRTGAVDALNRSLLTDFLPVQALRASAMSVLKNAGYLRGIFMREGIRPGGAFAPYKR